MDLLCRVAPQAGLLAAVPEGVAWLSPTEQARHASFATAARRDTFVAGRWLAREAVRQWRGGDRLPVLAVAASGACEVADEPGVFVSISHAGGHVACAVAAVPVGVDVETTARPRDALALARTVHGAAQIGALEDLPPEARLQRFLQWWTLKEAWLKARGRGLDFALMRRLAFDDGPSSDAAVCTVGDRVLAVVTQGVLPPVHGLPDAPWQRLQSRQMPSG